MASSRSRSLCCRCISDGYKLTMLLFSLGLLTAMTAFMVNHVAIVTGDSFTELPNETMGDRITRLHMHKSMIAEFEHFRELYAYASGYGLLVLLVVTYLDVILRR